jgi:hypothetical protein
MKPPDSFVQAAAWPPSPDVSKPTTAKLAIVSATSELTAAVKRHQSDILSLLWSVALRSTISASKIQCLRADNIAWMTSATICVQQARGMCFSLEPLCKIARSEEKEVRLLSNKETAHATLPIAAPNTTMMMSSTKDSNGYTTVGHHGGIITSFPKLRSLSPSPPCTNGNGIGGTLFMKCFSRLSSPLS